MYLCYNLDIQGWRSGQSHLTVNQAGLSLRKFESYPLDQKNMIFTAQKLNGFLYLKLILIWVVIVIIGVAGYFGYNYYLEQSKISISNNKNQANQNNLNADQPQHNAIDENEDFYGIANDKNALNSSDQEKKSLINQKVAKDPQNLDQNFNILVLGIDRRHANQTNWRTDVIQLITLNKNRTKAVVTHIPRDVWATNYKINSIYNLKGPDAIKDEISKITGQRPDRIIRVDFDAFVFAIDMVGGISITNPVEFTDSQYPNDRAGEEKLITIKFPKGEQEMDGETALQYVRSRKGTNGEGSDYARGKRQQLVMQTVVKDFFKPNNMFNPKTPETLYRIATEKVYTDISLKDTQVLFDLLKGYKNVKVENLTLDTNNYLTVPTDTANYGGAWTLVSKTGNYDLIHQKINELLQ